MKAIRAFSMTIVLLVLAGSLWAGGNTQNSSTGAAASPGGIAGDLTIWVDNDDWFDAITVAFNQKYPNVKLHYQHVGTTETVGKLMLDGPAGIGADVLTFPHNMIATGIADGLLEPFDAAPQAKYSAAMLDASIKTCSLNGKLYAVPLSTENIALFYNKDLLGNNPVPKSFEELITFARTWNNPSQNKWALRWELGSSYLNYFFFTAFGMKIFGPNMDDYHNPGWETPEAAKGASFFRSLRSIYNVNVADADWNSTVTAFQNGEVLFTITGPWAIADAKKNGVNFGVTKLPTINGVQPRSYSGNIVAGVSSYSKNFDAAFAFVDYLASPEGQILQFEKTGKLTTLKDSSLVPGISQDPYLLGILEQAPYADPMPSIPEGDFMWGPITTLLTFAWDTQIPIAEAQAKAIEEYDTSLQLAGKKR